MPQACWVIGISPTEDTGGNVEALVSYCQKNRLTLHKDKHNMATSGQGIGYTGEELLEEYISSHIEPESELLRDLYRETNLRLLNPRMASGHIQGRLLKMLTTMIRPKQVLEVGTFTGYATLCMAQGLPDDGKIHTVLFFGKISRPLVNP